MKLADHIEKNYASQYAYAKSICVTPSAVYKMVEKGYLWVDGVIYSPVRDTNKEK